MFHTRLGTFYLEKVLKLKSEGTSDSLLQSRYFSFHLFVFTSFPIRKKLQKFLEESSFYRASVFLNRVQDTDLYSECAILYGKVSMLSRQVWNFFKDGWTWQSTEFAGSQIAGLWWSREILFNLFQSEHSGVNNDVPTIPRDAVDNNVRKYIKLFSLLILDQLTGNIVN